MPAPHQDHPPAREQLGALPDGRPVLRHTLGRPGGLQLRVLDLGAVVQELWVPDREGRSANVVLGFADVDGYVEAADDFYGAVVGRFANRIAGAEVELDGTTYRLSANDGPHALHGGADGFHRRLWTVDDAGEDRIALSLVSPDGDQGFPGMLRASVTYEVTEDEVRIGYTAESDATTLVSLTQHAHFNLAGEGSGSVEGHLLRVAAARYTPVAADLIPTGEHADVARTPFDFREPRPIGERLRSDHPQLRRGRGYDHNFVLDGGPGPAAVLEEPTSGRRLEVHTDRPGLQVYTCNFQDGTHYGTSGRAYRQGDGVALETQTFPDGPHHVGEEGWPDPVLRAGETYRSATVWRFPRRS
jgi:aldose 1-epimerase